MPRKARIDAPGALHHIIGSGIERRKIYIDDDDRENFLERLGRLVSDSGTACYAWALIPNHFHLLLRTGDTPIAEVMRRTYPYCGHGTVLGKSKRPWQKTQRIGAAH